MVIARLAPGGNALKFMEFCSGHALGVRRAPRGRVAAISHQGLAEKVALLFLPANPLLTSGTSGV
ncbi:hypothetical protein AM507_00925 [Gardnerella vaginalis]|nr:hypothetical protein AM507_00925 [Gardnerella vaginalis]